MTLFLLNESKNIEVANDLLVFESLEDVTKYVEPIDVENDEYFIFDTDGQFYRINLTQHRDKFDIVNSNIDVDLAKRLVIDVLSRRGLVYFKSMSLEENARCLGLEKT